MPARYIDIQNSLERVDGELGSVKHHKMSLSPFAFFRGSVGLFYQDIASGSLPLPSALKAIPLTTIMGDCHCANFGFISEEGSHSNNIIFSPNDFDDACIGQAGWDLLRFCCSLFLCANYAQALSTGETKDRYIQDKPHKRKAFVSQDTAELAAQAFLNSYVETCQTDRPEIYQLGLDHFEKKHFLFKYFAKAKRRAAGGDDFFHKSTLSKSVNTDTTPICFTGKRQRFETVDKEEYLQIEHTFAPYMDDSILDIVKRVNAGTGSVNMDRYYLLVGPPNAGKDELPLCHLVEIKQQREAAAIHFFPELSPNNRLNPAHLTVMCQRRMQRAPDLVLDEVVWRKSHWLIRSRHHARVGFAPEDIALGKKASQGGFINYAISCGEALALSHCRGDRRSQLFEQAIAESLPKNISAISQTARNYAAQVTKDHQTLQQLLQDKA